LLCEFEIRLEIIINLFSGNIFFNFLLLDWDENIKIILFKPSKISLYFEISISEISVLFEILNLFKLEDGSLSFEFLWYWIIPLNLLKIVFLVFISLRLFFYRYLLLNSLVFALHKNLKLIFLSLGPLLSPESVECLPFKFWFILINQNLWRI